MGSDEGMSCSTSIPIDSSNLGFKVRFFQTEYQLRFLFLLDIYLPHDSSLQLLKKHGWKEGTGLGIAQQVPFSLPSSLKTLTYSHL